MGPIRGGRRDLTGAAACQPLIDYFMPLPWQLALFRQEDRTMTHPMHPAVFAVFLGALFAVPALAQSFPSKIVRVIVPSPAGSTVDLLARPLARELSAIWGQPVLIENISGGDYAIGATRAAAAAADGHTLFMTNHQPILGNRFLVKNLTYDPDKSLIPVTMTARGGSFVVVHPSMPVKSLRELVTLARGMPGKIAYASTGRGSAGQLTMEMLAARTGVSFNHIPYKGPSQALTALASGEVSLTTLTPAATGAMVKAGRVRAIAITSPNRTKLFPDVPTTAEAGYPDITYTFWMGLFAPAGTGAPILERIHRDTTTIVKRPEFAEKYVTSTGLDVVANSPAEFADAIRADVAIVGAMVKAAGLRPE